MSDFQLGIEQLRATHESVQALQVVAQDNEALQGGVELLEQLQLQQFYALCEMVGRSPSMVDFYAGALQRVQIVQAAAQQINEQLDTEAALAAMAKRASEEREELEAFFGLFAPEHPTYIAYLGRTTLAPQVQTEAVIEAPEAHKPQIGDSLPATGQQPPVGDAVPEPSMPEAPVEPDTPPVYFDLPEITRKLGEVSSREEELIKRLVERAKPGQWFNRGDLDLETIYFVSTSARNTAFSKLTQRLVEEGILEAKGLRGGRKYRFADLYTLEEPMEQTTTADAAEPEQTTMPDSTEPVTPAEETAQPESAAQEPEINFLDMAAIEAALGELKDREREIIACIGLDTVPGTWFQQKNLRLDERIDFSSDSARNQAFTLIARRLVETGVVIKEGEKAHRKYQVVDTFIRKPADEIEETPDSPVAEPPAPVTTKPVEPARAEEPPTDKQAPRTRQTEQGARDAETHIPRRMRKRWGLHAHGIRLDGRLRPYEGVEKDVLRFLTETPRREPVTPGLIADKLSVALNDVQAALNGLKGKLPQGWILETAGGNGSPNKWRLGSGIGLKEQREKK